MMMQRALVHMTMGNLTTNAEPTQVLKQLSCHPDKIAYRGRPYLLKQDTLTPHAAAWLHNKEFCLQFRPAINVCKNIRQVVVCFHLKIIVVICKVFIYNNFIPAFSETVVYMTIISNQTILNAAKLTGDGLPAILTDLLQ